MKNITILISGSGTNLERIIEAIQKKEIQNAKINLVVADRECYGLQRADNHHIPNILIQRGKNFCEELDNTIPKDTDLIVCAGFLSILTQDFCQKWAGKMINIHPSLLPKYGGKGMWGMNVHRAVIDNKETESGATVHFVTSGIDEGELILQDKVKLESGETPESLAEKIHHIEYELFPKAINKILN